MLLNTGYPNKIVQIVQELKELLTANRRLTLRNNSRLCSMWRILTDKLDRDVPPYPTLNLLCLNFSGCCHSDLEQSSAARHICSVSSCHLDSLEDILLRTVLFIIVLSCLRSDIIVLDTLIRFTYLKRHFNSHAVSASSVIAGSVPVNRVLSVCVLV